MADSINDLLVALKSLKLSELTVLLNSCSFELERRFASDEK